MMVSRIVAICGAENSTPVQESGMIIVAKFPLTKLLIILVSNYV